MDNVIINDIKILDCTFRDGGYYVNWDFPSDLVNDYLLAMSAAKIDVVELGFRFFKNDGFKGANAFTTDDYLRTLVIPNGLEVAVMVNGSDLLINGNLEFERLEMLFPESANSSPVSLVRIACHFYEFVKILPAMKWLKQKGFGTGINLMQISDRTIDEIEEISLKASNYPLDVLYFADSLGSMKPEEVNRIVLAIKKGWKGEIGIHTHDNQGMGLINTVEALKSGVKWLDSTVTGMGRGPGNTLTENLILELASIRDISYNILPLLILIRKFFKPLKEKYSWGSNPFYFISGKYGIHPTYVQEMLNDSRYSEEDILSVLEQLKNNGGKKFSQDSLTSSRNFFDQEPMGSWSPDLLLKDKIVLLIGTGPSVEKYKSSIIDFIKKNNLIVIALNSQNSISDEFIDLRIACHPFRILADLNEHEKFTQPLITPLSLLPKEIAFQLLANGKKLYDYGLKVESEKFIPKEKFCIIPGPLVLAYSMAVIYSGKAKSIYLVGFDGYNPGDSRNDEIESLFKNIINSNLSPKIVSLTPTKYNGLDQKSIFGFL